MSSPPIRVLHVFGRMDRGGAEMRTLDLLPPMRERGVQFDFCAMSEGEGALDTTVKEAGSTIHICKLNGPKLKFVRAFRKLMREQQPDILHCHIHLTSGLLVTLARSAGVKHRIVHFRNTSDGRSTSLPRRLYQATMRRMIRMNASAILAVSHGAMAGGLGDDWQKNKRAQVIYNGIDQAKFPIARPDTAALRQELALPDDAILVAQVGRFAPAKAHDITLQAIKQIREADPRYAFLFVGEGDGMPQTKQLAAELCVQDNVRFLGLRSDVPTLLAQADLSVLPSHWEGLPGAVLESLAAGTNRNKSNPSSHRVLFC